MTIVLALALVACDPGSKTSEDTDADAHSDADADASSEGEANSGSDAEGESESESESDGDCLDDSVGTLNGHLVDWDGDTPFAATVRVEALPADGADRPGHSTWTAADGTFSLVLEPGEWWVEGTWTDEDDPDNSFEECSFEADRVEISACGSHTAELEVADCE